MVFEDQDRLADRDPIQVAERPPLDALAVDRRSDRALQIFDHEPTIHALDFEDLPMSFAGPGKRDAELEQAISAEITINLESEGEAARVLTAFMAETARAAIDRASELCARIAAHSCQRALC